MNDTTRAFGRAATLALGAVWGAALGLVELGLRLGAPSPSEGRRALELVVQVGLQHALLGALVGAFVLVLGRGSTARVRASRWAVPLAFGVAAAILWWLGDVEVGEKTLARAGRRFRFGALLATAAAWIVTFLAVRRGLERRFASAPPGRRAETAFARRALLFAPGLLVAIAGGTILQRGARAAATQARPSPEKGPTAASTIAPRAGAPRHVLFVLADTLRADVLGCYLPFVDPATRPREWHDVQTPHTDALAGRGTLFTQVQAPGSWTLPSVATVLSGRLPNEHGVVEFSGVLEAVSFPSLFARSYDTAAFLGNPLVSEARGMDAGFRLFDLFDHAVEARLFWPNALWEIARLAGLVEYAGRRNLVARLVPRAPLVETHVPYYPLDLRLVRDLERFAPPDADRPSFTYVQFVAPHDPYFTSPPGFFKERAALVRSELPRVRELYGREVERFDRALGELLAVYERAGVLDDTLVVLTSDHGEELQEHGGWTHGHTLYEEVVRVPLIVAGPGVASGRTVQERVALTDVAPTLLALCGLDPAELRLERPVNGEGDEQSLGSTPGRGTDLSPLLAVGSGAVGASELPERLFAELSSQILNPGERMFSVVEGRHKLVRHHREDGTVGSAYYDLERDPAERDPGSLPDELAELRTVLMAYEELAIEAAPGVFDEDTHQRMQDLGYADKAD